jgi:hypothetical protein
MARAGRKKKTTVLRDSSGKSRGEIFDPSFHHNQPHRKAFMTVIEGRKLDHTEPKLVNQAGYPLGRLRIALAITGDQLRAGNGYASLVRSYGRRMGIQIGSPKSGSMSERISTGFSPFEADINPDHQQSDQEIQDLYDDCHCALVKLGREHNRGNRILIVMREICITEQDEHHVWRDDAKLGDLRLGLNAVHRVLLERRS